MFNVCRVRSDVTHIVSEYENFEQVKNWFEKREVEIPKSCQFLNLKWLTSCLKGSDIVSVEDIHLIKETIQIEPEKDNLDNGMSEWACQRVTKLEHHNKKLTDAIEVLQKHAELRDGIHDYSRALAFRRASCILKSLSFKVLDVKQLDGLRDIGDHVKKVLSAVLDTGYCSEVEEIIGSSWYKKMELFTSVFGVGPSTAKKWIENGFESLEDVKRKDCGSNDWRVIWGLGFSDDLNTPVQKLEAETFLSIVQEEAEKILPGTIVQLCGGFRRGKSGGHDVDILLSHPIEGREQGLLDSLLETLQKKQIVLIGKLEKSSFRQEYLYNDSKLSGKSHLDHFEKWLGICKFPKISSKEEYCSLSQKNENNEFVELLNQDKECSSSNIQTDNSDESTYQPKSKKAKFIPLKENVKQLADSNRSWKACRVDLIVSPYSQFYFALVGWTGSKHFNRDIRLYAQRVLGMKLTSHGLYDMNKLKTLTACSEEEVFKRLNLEYKTPEERNC